MALQIWQELMLPDQVAQMLRVAHPEPKFGGNLYAGLAVIGIELHIAQELKRVADADSLECLSLPFVGIRQEPAFELSEFKASR